MALSITLWIAAPHPCSAFDFQPIVAQLAPSGPNSSRSFLVTNTHPRMVAIELQVFKRSHAADGEELRELDENDFIIVPAQLVLPAGSSQTVNVQWIGSNEIDREASYRLIARQIPIDFQAAGAAGEAQVKLAVSYVYEAALYITPPGAQPALRLERAEPDDTRGTRQLKLTFVSEGRTRAIIEKAELRLKPLSGANFVTLTAQEVEPLLGQNFIAGSKQTISIPWPESVPFGPVEADFRPGYLVLR